MATNWERFVCPLDFCVRHNSLELTRLILTLPALACVTRSLLHHGLTECHRVEQLFVEIVHPAHARHRRYLLESGRLLR